MLWKKNCKIMTSFLMMTSPLLKKAFLTRKMNCKARTALRQFCPRTKQFCPRPSFFVSEQSSSTDFIAIHNGAGLNKTVLQYRDAKGVILLDILPQGQCINAARNCSTFDRLKEAIRRKRPGLLRRGVVLQHASFSKPYTAMAAALRLGNSSSSCPQFRPDTL
ncbi:histone-lysine N-methyltransferase SETMAR [Plakobranchus ocellatus]|uniref:Histone-lysine N-methyltransferase SETMAR n=1 Tax=Plakobranchus ocellatus TaxID=259542 RepID=A0AAV4D931_9GAST|nr:histone-lysine N-methyltransferase SETMAR [Plakobranchus ocellatus]